MKKENLISFLSPLFCVLLGIMTLVTADKALEIICYIACGALILTGIALIIRYLTRTMEENMASNSFLLGFVLLLLGITGVIKAEAIVNFIPFALGFLIAVNGIRELQNAIDVYRLKLPKQWVVVLVSLVNLVLGVVLMVNPGFAADVLMKVIGVGLILSGVSDLITTMVVLKRSDRKAG